MGEPRACAIFADVSKRLTPAMRCGTKPAVVTAWSIVVAIAAGPLNEDNMKSFAPIALFAAPAYLPVVFR